MSGLSDLGRRMDEAVRLEQFEAVVRDDGADEWIVMLTGSPEQVRTKVVAEAGMMAQGGWIVRGVNRQQITCEDPDTGRRTVFRIRKVVQ